MQFNDVQQMWKLQEGGRGESYRQEAERTVQTMDRARKGQRAFLIYFSAITAVSTGVVGTALAKGNRIDWAEVWPVALLQVGAVLTLVALWRIRMRREGEYQRCGASVRQAAEWGLATVQKQIREMKILAGWAAVFVPLIALQLVNLYGSGKMDQRAIMSFSAVCAAILLVNAVILTVRFQTRLRPQRERLSMILTELDAH